MTSVQEQYTSAVRQSQENWAGMVESLTGNLQRSFTLPTQTGAFDPTAAIDQVFDFWGKTLEIQRDVAKQVAGVSLSLGDRVRTQAESVTNAVREQAETATRAVREQSKATEHAERQQEAAKRAEAAQKYDDFTKAELQEELAGRDLPKTGNVDELRERLVVDDGK